MLKGKTALITGSLGGLGLATAKALAGMGCDVMLNGFASAGTIAARVADIEALGVRCAHHNADLRKPAEIADLVNATTTTFGGPDILVNNAVVRYFGATEDFNPEHWDEALAVNLSVYDPLLGKTYAEIGTEARSMHKCQGMAQLLSLPAPLSSAYWMAESAIPGQKDRDEQSLFDAIDASLQGLAQYAGAQAPAELTSGLAAIDN